jgi:hypothetical protein
MTLTDGRRLFGKIYSTSHERADRWYRFGRTILYGQLEDETPVGSVRRPATHEDYALRLLADHHVRVARTYGVVELTPNQEYMLVTEFFEHATNLGDAQVDTQVIDEGLALRTDPDRVYARATRVFSPDSSPRPSPAPSASPSQPSSRPR